MPELDPKAVSVLDQTGALLTGSADASARRRARRQQLQYVNQIESGYAKRIVELLEPVVGRDNLRATVTADIDFSQTEATSEEFKPNQGADASVRSAASRPPSSRGAAGGALPSGVPGAASNQPPVAGDRAAHRRRRSRCRPRRTPAARGSNGRREAVTNYEVDKTVRVTRNATGTVKRLNAAVVVNHRAVDRRQGQDDRRSPLTSDEIDKLTALVQREHRLQAGARRLGQGDQRAVQDRDRSTRADELPLWKQPDSLDLLRAGGRAGGAGARRAARLLRPGRARR